MEESRYPLEPLFGRILSPFEQFLQRTTAGGIVLVATTIVALALGKFTGITLFSWVAVRSGRRAA